MNYSNKNDYRPTNGQNKRMANFQVNGQIKDFSKMANGHGPFTKWKNLNRRMAKLKNWPFTSNLAIRLFWPFVGPDRVPVRNRT